MQIGWRTGPDVDKHVVDRACHTANDLHFLVRWPLPDLVKWLIIVISAFTIILGLYEFLVRRADVLRFLFGMKPQIKERRSQPVLITTPE